MTIRKTQPEDLEEVMGIYAWAREQMAAAGNPRQWGMTKWPPRTLIEEDIRKGKSYVCTDGDRIAAVFYYDAGPDIEPTYRRMEEGCWAEDSPYGVVHRIAAARGTRGAGSRCILWALEQSGHLRIDTHGDNRVMQHVLEKLGFEYRGIIHVTEDPDPRLAYERIARKEG